MRKLVLILVVVFLLMGGVVQAEEPTPAPTAPVLQIKLLTEVDGFLWFEATNYCDKFGECVPKPIVGFRPVSKDGSKVPCFYFELKDKLCYVTLLNPLAKTEEQFVFYVFVTRKGLDRDLFIVAPKPVPPTATPLSDDSLSG